MTHVSASYPPIAATADSRRVEVYAGALAVSAGIVSLVVFQRWGWADAAWWLVALLAGVAFLAERQCVPIGPNTEMSISVLPLLFAAVVFGPLPAMLVGACALLGEFRRPYARWVVWTSSRALLGALAGVVAFSISNQTSSFGGLLLSVVVAALVQSGGDIILNGLTIALRKSGSVLETASAIARLMAGTVPLYAPVLSVLVYAYRELSPWTVLLFFVPAVAAQRLLVLYQQQRQLVTELATANTRLEEAGLSFASALVAALDARDKYTAGHSAAVAVYARDIAERLGLPEADQRLAHLAGLLHDIGKVGLPAGILEKTGPLTLEERRAMEEHSVIGERILANVHQYAELAKIVRHHHERVDGNGYPDRIRHPEIPLISRIIAVADAYNAMTSGRPYRDAMPSRVARFRLAQAVDSQFDTTVVAAFEAILASSPESYLSGDRADFAVEAQRQPVLARAIAFHAA
jgi:putative nucleotidyltransferase with HDIG domain